MKTIKAIILSTIRGIFGRKRAKIAPKRIIRKKAASARRGK